MKFNKKSSWRMFFSEPYSANKHEPNEVFPIEVSE